MLNVTCNIDKTDRINRTVLGIFLVLGVVLGFGKWFFFLFGIIMIAEGVIGWCGIPVMMEKLGLKK